MYAGFLPAVALVIVLDWLTIKIHPEAYQYGQAFDLKTLTTNLLMLQYFPSIPFGSGRPFWALPLWWWTYLSFGWVVLAIKSIKNHPIAWWLIFSFFSAIPVYSLFAGRGKGLVVVWLMGSLVFWALTKKFWRQIKPMFNFWIGVVFWLLAWGRVWQTRIEYEFVFGLLLAIGFCFIIAALQDLTAKFKQFSIKTFQWLAGYSLTLYLTHFSVNSFLLLFRSEVNPVVFFILVFIMCNFTAMGLAHFFERRQTIIGKLYNRYFAKLIARLDRLGD